MALNKVEICGVNTSRLPILTNEEKELLFEKDKKRGQRGKRTVYQGKSSSGTQCDQTFSGSNENADDLFRSDASDS